MKGSITIKEKNFIKQQKEVLGECGSKSTESSKMVAEKKVDALPLCRRMNSWLAFLPTVICFVGSMPKKEIPQYEDGRGN